MPKVNVYLPDALYRQVRELALPLSAITQQAIREAVTATSNRAWIEAQRSRSGAAAGRIDTAALLDEVRTDFGA